MIKVATAARLTSAMYGDPEKRGNLDVGRTEIAKSEAVVQRIPKYKQVDEKLIRRILEDVFFEKLKPSTSPKLFSQNRQYKPKLSLIIHGIELLV